MTTYLFNIIDDPHENNNVADQHPGMVRELLAPTLTLTLTLTLSLSLSLTLTLTLGV